MRTFDELQEQDLGSAVAANRPGSGVPHVVIALASYSMSETVLSHYGERVLALEHRYLVSSLMTHRLPDVHWLYLSSLRPDDALDRYYRTLGPDPGGFAARTRLLDLGDTDGRSLAAKVLERPDVVARIRDHIGGRTAFIEPWNVTEAEVAVAEALQVPAFGTAPRLWPLGFKSAGRRLFREAGVPVPVGVEDVRDVEGILEAVARIRRERPAAPGVVVKHDNSGAGDGNTVIDLRGPDGRALDDEDVRRQVLALPEWYLADLASGGVVEELIAGTAFSSPSAQIDVEPDGEVRVLATHEQVLGGDRGQVFLGCRFPADPAYAGELARHARAAGARLAAQGVLGRASVDFAAVRDEDGRWSVHALEVNLRKGGTTHPYCVLRNLVPGRYDEERGSWIAADGRPRSYVCTDNLVDPAWKGLGAGDVIDAVRSAGLQFDHRRGVGVVLHMLSGLGIDGRFGLTAIAGDVPAAQDLSDRTREVLDRLASCSLAGVRTSH